MTKLRTHRLFTLVPSQSRDEGSLEKPRLPVMICIVGLFCAAAVNAAPAQGVVFTSLASFDGADGASPIAPLVQATDGNFYGTTNDGGANYCGSGNYCGTVFRITPAGELTMLHSFDGSDGHFPYAGLVQGTDGNFYGTTQQGGAYNFGTVFKITPSGTLTTLYSFCAQGGPCPDGAYPVAGLVQATDGNFYGPANSGGAHGFGEVFRITPAGTLTTLYSFCSQPNCADGAAPDGPLVQASDGNFYGTTVAGGANYCGGGSNCGTVFSVTPAGALTTLHSFDGSDGQFPYAGLVQGTDGNLYGTTHGESPNNPICAGTYGCGTVFKITLGGTLTTLLRFDGSDGAYPYAGLAQASDGYFYGTTP